MKNLHTGFRGMTFTPPNVVRYRIPKSEITKTNPESHRLAAIPEEGRDNEVLGNMELPTINYDMINGKDYNYCYGVTGLFKDSKLVKINVKTKESTYWEPPKNVMPSAPWFVSSPGAKSEDDGAISANCTGANGAESFFLVLDAKTMKEVCRANMHVGMGLMIHGNWFNT